MNTLMLFLIGYVQRHLLDTYKVSLTETEVRAILEPTFKALQDAVNQRLNGQQGCEACE